ncbi:hypothetical protein BURK2_02886 [Burkholderiales bacterium]|nr:MAG: hypothetical protein F9K47_13475 [Burkholderiales bacterium]CAG0999305.1 hypothetical protein BURK2_02886 [Burkholderiales bacterium]
MSTKLSLVAESEPAEPKGGAGGGGSVIRVGSLDSIAAVRTECARLYRAARRASGPEPDAQTAGRLTYILQAIARCIEGSELEKRVAALEQRDRP